MKLNKLLITTSILLAGIVLVNPIYSQEKDSTESAEIDVIKENVKQRIRQAVQGETTIAHTTVAFSGTLSSIANQTLTIDGQSGIKLASTSATTVYVSSDDDAPAKAEDMTIDNFIVALGFVNGSQVLDARKIILHENIPTPPENQSEYGMVTSFDAKLKTVTINNPFTNQSTTGTISKKTDYLEIDSKSDTVPTDEDAIIVNQSYALVVYQPSTNGDENVIESILLNNTNVQATKDQEATSSAAEALPPELQY